MNYTLLLLALGIIIKFIYENAPDSVYLKVGKSLKVLFVFSIVLSMSFSAGSIVLNFTQPVSADSNVDNSVYEQQIATLQIQLEDCRNQLNLINESLACQQQESIQDTHAMSVKEEKETSEQKKEKEKKKSKKSSNKTTKVISDVRMRANASTNSEVLCVLNRGVKLEVLDIKGSWVKVKYRNLTGYISKRFCEDF